MRSALVRLVRSFSYTTNSNNSILYSKWQESALIHSRRHYKDFGHARQKESVFTVTVVGILAVFMCIGSLRFVQ